MPSLPPAAARPQDSRALGLESLHEAAALVLAAALTRPPRPDAEPDIDPIHDEDGTVLGGVRHSSFCIRQ